MNPIRRQPSRCSFCHETGHNIKGCKNIHLLIFEKNVLTKRNENLSRPDMFRIYLNNECATNTHICHAFAVKCCQVLTRTRDSESIINGIYDRFMLQQSRTYFVTVPPLRIAYIRSLSYRVRCLDILINQIQHPNQNQNQNTEDYLLPQVNLQLLFDLEDINDSDSDDDNEFVGRILTSVTPPSIKKFPIQKKLEIETNTSIKNMKTMECPICYEEVDIKNVITLQCNKNHSFCKTCILSQLETSNNNKTPHCALCRELMSVFCIRSKAVEEEINAKIF